MSEKKGKLIACDRCHEKTVFLEQVGTRGVSNYDNSGEYPVYEELPKDWLHVSGMGHMCPICARSFTEFLKTFFGEDGYERLAPRYKFVEEAELEGEKDA